jgi:2'-5' RNA ligase
MRLFVAMDIPGDVRSAVGALVEKLRHTTRQARWVRVEGLHVTLKFIGEISPEKVEAIQSSLASVSFQKPVAMKFRGLGFFPNERRPRVLWIGIDVDPELAGLAAAIETALAPLGIPKEGRAFSPHLTLARFDSPKGLERLREMIGTAGALEFGSSTAGEFYLYQSVLKRGGAEYTRLATFASAGKGA